MPQTEIAAVHISGLLDPTAYLSGGGLLLITGLLLSHNRIGCRRYVARLVRSGISALALGLGPAHQEPPEHLVDACRQAGLASSTVPAPTLFLTIPRAYWSARSWSTETQLTDAVAAHRALVDAAFGAGPGCCPPAPPLSVLEGWAALLDANGEVDQVYPLSVSEDAEALRAEVARLEVAGVPSSMSFSVGSDFVVVFPLAVEDRIVGYLAPGSPRQLEARQRRLVLTAAAQLSLDVVREQRSESAREAARRCVALLIEAGIAEASRRLAAGDGCTTPQRRGICARRPRSEQ